jgi:hypothetical protein
MRKISKLMMAFIALSFALAACGGGGSTAVGGGTTTSANKVFITSVSGTGNLSSWTDSGGKTGVAAGDAICQTRASAVGLSGTYKAWLSDATTDAYCHIFNLTGTKTNNCGQASLPIAAGPWVRTDGFPFSKTIDELVNGVIYAPLVYDEIGTFSATSTWPRMFTGTTSSGTLQPGLSCSDWTSAAPTDNAFVGFSDYTTAAWTSGPQSSDCNTSRRLACFQTGAGAPLPDHSTPGKKVFISSAFYNGNLGGPTGANTKCQTLAAAAGLANSGNFKAWLSTTTVDAKDRLTSNGPWVRVDGVKIADNKTDLIDGTLFTAINVTETGAYVTNSSPWTSTNPNGTKNTANGTCIDWSSSLNADHGGAGMVNSVREWSLYGYGACDLLLRLYCFED